jgi:hypothetical protein
MQEVFEEYTSACDSLPAGCQTIFPFALGADTFGEAFNNAAVIHEQSARMEQVQQVINDIAIVLSQEDAVIQVLDIHLARLKRLQEKIIRLGVHQDEFATAMKTQGALAVATVEFYRPHLRQAVKTKFKLLVTRLDDSIADDIARNTHWITTYSRNLPDDIQNIERH